MKYVTIIGIVGMASALQTSEAAEDPERLIRTGEIKVRVQKHSERSMLDETVAAEQARTRAQSRGEFGIELRPHISNNEIGIALRMYMPDGWSRKQLREQLILVSKAEQLRVSALEWLELMKVYQEFCSYRMYKKQCAIFEKELTWLQPYLEKADRSVAQNHLSVAERAKLYSLYLDLLNRLEKARLDLQETEQKLKLLLGVNAELEAMAEAARLELPQEAQIHQLLQQALKNRSDYRQFEYRTRMLKASEDAARSEDGFQLKYIQPFYDVDYNDGDSTIGLSASFILPWGTRNPDIAVFQEEQLLTDSSRKLMKMVIEHRLEVLARTAEAYYSLARNRSDRIKPLLTQLALDLESMNTGRLEDLRDQMLVRERMLDVSIETTRSIRRKELLAVEFATELGSLAP